MRGLAGKVALVTGAASGIGAATAVRLSEEGALTALVDVDLAAAARLAERLPGEALALRADVSVAADVERSMREAVARFGRVDLVHLNAGVPGPFGPLVDVDVEAFDAVVAVNLRGVFLGLRAALRHFGQRGGPGSIVVTSSLAGLHGADGLGPYAATKHGVIGLMRAAALEGARSGVRVNAIAPGLVETPMQAPLREALGGGQTARRALAGVAPLGRIGTAAEVAALVAFLLSEEASFTTGGVHVVDGGVEAGDPVRLAAPGGQR